jgi:hypothetical protein
MKKQPMLWGLPAKLWPIFISAPDFCNIQRLSHLVHNYTYNATASIYYQRKYKIKQRLSINFNYFSCPLLGGHAFWGVFNPQHLQETQNLALSFELHTKERCRRFLRQRQCGGNQKMLLGG